MKRFIQGEYRGQSALLPESLDDYVADTNPVRVVDFSSMNSTLASWASLVSSRLKANVRASGEPGFDKPNTRCRTEISEHAPRA